MEIFVAIVPFGAVVAIAVGLAYHTFRQARPRLSKLEAPSRLDAEPGGRV